MRICIDPGHAGRLTDPGAVSPFAGLRESDVVLSMAFMVQRYLQAVGYEVLLTRIQEEQAETDDLAYRTNLSNSWGADVFVSLHCNSVGNSSVQGYEVWTSPGQTQGDVLATKIFNQIAGAFPDRAGRTDYSDGDADKESKFYVLVYTDAPACLVEMAFLSNAEETALLSNLTWRDWYARAIARGITDYAGGV